MPKRSASIEPPHTSKSRKGFIPNPKLKLLEPGSQVRRFIKTIAARNSEAVTGVSAKSCPTRVLDALIGSGSRLNCPPADLSLFQDIAFPFRVVRLVRGFIDSHPLRGASRGMTWLTQLDRKLTAT